MKNRLRRPTGNKKDLNKLYHVKNAARRAAKNCRVTFQAKTPPKAAFFEVKKNQEIFQEGRPEISGIRKQKSSDKKKLYWGGGGRSGQKLGLKVQNPGKVRT